MNSSKLLLAAALTAGLVVTALLSGCGNTPVVTNPDVQPTKAVLGDPATLRFNGKRASGAPVIVPGRGLPPSR